MPGIKEPHGASNDPKSQVTRQLLDLGVHPAGCCWYTAPFPGEAGGGWAGRLIAALRSALGPEGTLVMPSMTADDDHPFDRAPLLASAWASSPRPSGSCRAYCAATARTPSPRLARRLPVSPPRTGGCPAWIGQPGWPEYMNWMGGAAARRGSHRQYYHPPGRVYETRPATGARNT